ncbi:hypothetical protein LTR99_006371 [Exophiala xenobiotica]|uniref:CENP-V/GFA domain-containing protein n=1 Tax=Vermiconidia calcicola TaxID=1690605 RepID=A0AAV9Q7H0_9PEZI|nr:hypothetical protein LTR92_009971 [Exophiala xenobiotica]KAK5534947.1 hypothetical protein LTR23_008502 [Chaetothyriales sp. CCFEE 6169]KAK5537542.1 hypothetical protein LTR25_004794 [Vermiconidia calcicola]KAK5242479.1 hypothetical protein LTS06_011498 [Exophiala xenobiotica]KAK5267186.1 hypothetical protein LTR96_007219 [Exophiala xenobiotica]
MNFFHVHPANPRDDFMLLSPHDPDVGLSTYQCNDRKRKYYFCPKCGVRCFTFTGVGETDVVDFKKLQVLVGDSTQELEGKREVWRAKWDGEDDTRPYLSVNATTIDVREDFDLRLLTEEKRVKYLDGRSEPEDEEMEARWDRPHYGGCY